MGTTSCDAKIAFYVFHQLVSYLTWVWTTCLYPSAYLAANCSFSAVSLITALLATQLFLPYLFYRYQPTTLLPERKTFNLIQKGLNTFANKRFNKGTLLIISLF